MKSILLTGELLLQVQQISYFLEYPENISNYSKIKLYEMIFNNPYLIIYALEFKRKRRKKV